LHEPFQIGERPSAHGERDNFGHLVGVVTEDEGFYLRKQGGAGLDEQRDL
jgi:hypothetical protein